MNVFRVAREAPVWRHVVATLAQTAVFWTVFLFALPAAVVAGERALGAGGGLRAVWTRPAGAVLFVLGGALGLWSGLMMARRGRGTPLPAAAARELVLAGPYRALRNPMALGGIAQGVAVGLWRGSPGVVLYALAGAVVWHVVARPVEERFLLARFGAAFAAYRERVPLWLPRVLPRPAERLLAAGAFAGAAWLTFVGVTMASVTLGEVLHDGGAGPAAALRERFVPPAAADRYALAYRLAPPAVLGLLLGVLLWSRNAAAVDATPADATPADATPADATRATQRRATQPVNAASPRTR